MYGIHVQLTTHEQFHTQDQQQTTLRADNAKDRTAHRHAKASPRKVSPLFMTHSVNRYI